jgi:hypothetical protein
MKPTSLQLVLAGSLAMVVSSARCESSSQGLKSQSDAAVVSEESRAAAATLLDARRNSIELILSSQPAPYYLVGPKFAPEPPDNKRHNHPK